MSHGMMLEYYAARAAEYDRLYLKPQRQRDAAHCHTPQVPGSSTLQWNLTLAPTPYRWNQPATTAGTSYPTFAGNTLWARTGIGGKVGPKQGHVAPRILM